LVFKGSNMHAISRSYKLLLLNFRYSELIRISLWCRSPQFYYILIQPMYGLHFFFKNSFSKQNSDVIWKSESNDYLVLVQIWAYMGFYNVSKQPMCRVRVYISIDVVKVDFEKWFLLLYMSWWPLKGPIKWFFWIDDNFFEFQYRAKPNEKDFSELPYNGI